MQRLSVPPRGPAGGSISCTSALPAPSTRASAALFAGLPPWDSPGRCSTDLLAGCPPHLGDCAWATTVSSRPTKEDLLTLQELLSRFSGASKSTVGHLGDPHWSAPQECCWMSSQLLPGCRGSRAPG